MTRLRAQAQKCKFLTGTEDDNLFDQFINGVAHENVCKRLLSHDLKDLTMDKCFDYAHTFEAPAIQLQQSEISTVTARWQKQLQRHLRNHGNQQKSSSRQTTQSKAKKYFCGGKPHKRDQCPAKAQMCNKCHNKGHWRKVRQNEAKQLIL